MITSIKFDAKIFEGYSIAEDENLNNLNKIDVFIGKNNSGKSRFLRLLLKNKFDVERTNFNSDDIHRMIDEFKNKAGVVTQSIFTRIRRDQATHSIKEISEITFVKEKSELSNLISRLRGLPIFPDDPNQREILPKIIGQIENYFQKFDENSLNFNKTYIPILRGLRPLQLRSIGAQDGFELSENNYLKRSKSDYEIKLSEKVQIHTGLDLYQKVKEYILGDDDDREKLKKFEEYLSETFFQKDTVHLISREGKDVLYVKIGKDKQLPIYDLGEGIQAIILLTYPLFFNEGKEMLFFVEEPELHLHPGLERVLIETMRDERFESYQYFITTHSNHILDLTLEYDDISVYSFQKKTNEPENSFQIENVANSKQKQVLDLLGVRNSSVFLANCTIWVEGITDRLYLRKYIELLQKEKKISFKEDYHYAFIEYAGSNITHWSFLESDNEEFANINIEGICSKVFLIVDNDGVELPEGKKKKKQERQEQLQQKLGANFYSTKGREIENLLSKNIIKQVIKKENIKVASLDFTEFDKKDYSKACIGDFIDNNVGGLKKKYATDYGTIKDKVGFCKTAISMIRSVDDLSDEAKELSNLILAFIESNNSKTY